MLYRKSFSKDNPVRKEKKVNIICKINLMAFAFFFIGSQSWQTDPEDYRDGNDL